MSLVHREVPPRSRGSRFRKPAILALSTLIAATLLADVPPAEPASADEGSTTIPLAEASIPALIADDSGLALLAAHNGEAFDPAGAVFGTPAGEATAVPVVVDTAAAPEGYAIEDLELTYEVLATPAEGSLQIAALDEQEVRTAWAPGQSLTIASDGAGALEWQFDTEGEYAINVTGTASIAADGESEEGDVGGSGAGGEQAVEVSANYRFEVEPSDGETTEPNPAEQKQPAPSTQETVPESQDAEPTVLDEGDIRLATKRDESGLSQSVMVVEGDGSFERYPVESTIISIQNSEPWPGGVPGQPARVQSTWEEWVPDKNEVWRTLSKENPETGFEAINPLTISFDTGFVPWSGYPGDLLGTTTVSISDVSTSGGGELVVHDARTRLIRPDGKWELGSVVDSRPGTNSPFGFSNAGDWTGNPNIYDEPGVSDKTLGRTNVTTGFVFTEPGVYCVTAASSDSQAGPKVEHSATYTFAVGVEPAGVELCEQPQAENPDDPGPEDPPGEPGDEEFTEPVATGADIALAARLQNGTFSLGGYVASDQAQWFSPQETVISIPKRDEQEWSQSNMIGAASGFQGPWRSVADPDEILFRTKPGKTDDGVAGGNTFQVRPDASFVPKNGLDIDANVRFELGAVEGPEGGRLSTYHYESGASTVAVPSTDRYWNSEDRSVANSIRVQAGSGSYPGSLDSTAEAGLGLAFNEPGRYWALLERGCSPLSASLSV
ncbi:hypothetical protein [Gulosibacter sp. 10]|uniref:hypothetical protein n=1 Tax=Gulosibacter sp. 10 TaxID=1255570 RepID=UPI00111FF826|nr:hypothetical protein [Gulosibacter sp. 10]